MTPPLVPALPPDPAYLKWAPLAAGLGVAVVTLLLWRSLGTRAEEELALMVFLGLGLVGSVSVASALHWGRLAHRHAATVEAAGRALGEANERLKTIDRMKDEFLMMVSHDLRTPLASTKSAVENLLDEIVGPVTSEQREHLEIIGRSTARLTRLIDDLIDVARIEAGVFSVEPRDTDLLKPVRAAIEEARTLAEARAVRITVDLPSTPVSIRVDPDRLHQAFANLLGNAVRHARSEIRVGVRLDAEAVHATVENDGEGIPGDERERIFERFHQAGPEEKRGVCGLGLSLVRGIVEAHGGRVRAETVEGGDGNRFVVRLPRTEGGRP